MLKCATVKHIAHRRISDIKQHTNSAMSSFSKNISSLLGFDAMHIWCIGANFSEHRIASILKNNPILGLKF